MKQLSVFSLACTIHPTIPSTAALCPSPSFHLECLGVFFSFSVLLSCPGLLLSLIISNSYLCQHLQLDQWLSEQEGDTLLFSTDLITEVLFARLKRNTCTNNVLTAAYSS